MNQPESVVIWATVENSNHPEYGVAMIPFPIPRESYDSYMEKLRAMGIGDPLKQDWDNSPDGCILPRIVPKTRQCLCWHHSSWR